MTSPAAKRNSRWLYTHGRSFSPPGFLYDLFFEPLLKGIRKKIAGIVRRESLFPMVDLCCGTGALFRYFPTEERRLLGLDLNPGLVRYAAAKHSQLPFICADALFIPLKNTTLRAVVISFALHDKEPASRSRILAEVKRVLIPQGRVIFVDFELPWSRRTRWASLFTTTIERLAGKEHFNRNRDFLRQGGLRAFVRKSRLQEIERYDIEGGPASLVVTKFEVWSHA